MAINLDIIRAIQNKNDRDVFELMYKKYLPMMKSLIYKYNGRPEETKDLFHDTLIVLIREVEQGRVNEQLNLDNYVYTIAKNLYLNILKKSNKLVVMDMVPETTMPEEISVERHLDIQKSEDLIVELIKQLGDKCYHILQAIFFEKQKQEQIAEELGLSDRHVIKTYKNRCKNKLIELVKKNPKLSAQFIHTYDKY